MVKKIILGLVAGIIVVAGVAAISAYEAHIINVTAHIENALYVHDQELTFGTVFPQEYLTKQFTVELSKSFQDEPTADDVTYVIKQKPKCINGNGGYAPVDYATHKCPGGYEEMLSLCPYLSKMDGDDEDGNDKGVSSYYVENSPDYCVGRTGTEEATGYLAKSWNNGEGDLSDLWIVDLKVPPVKGYVGQDWPAGCPTVEKNDQDYGCDLWIEVTGISEQTQSCHFMALSRLRRQFAGSLDRLC